MQVHCGTQGTGRLALLHAYLRVWTAAVLHAVASQPVQVCHQGRRVLVSAALPQMPCLHHTLAEGLPVLHLAHQLNISVRPHSWSLMY